MEKFKSLFKFPCNVQCNSPQAEVHRQATQETHPHLFGDCLYCLAGGRMFRKLPKHYTGVINQRVRGGKWEEVFFHRGETAADFLKRVGAVKAEFRGGPKLR